jgi:hypothetical protein
MKPRIRCHQTANGKWVGKMRMNRDHTWLVWSCNSPLDAIRACLRWLAENR